MATVAIQRIADVSKPVPFFEELDRQFEQVRRRAFELFENRGRKLGHDLEDWIRAEHEVMGWPAAELEENDNEYKLEMTLPGFEANQVEVTAAPDEIVVHAAIKPEKKPGNARIVWSEFGPNDVCRRFRMPQPIDVSRTKATLDQGLLKIIAAKAPQAQRTAIPVATA